MLFDCGDSLRGSQTVYHRTEPIVAEMDAAGYDAQAIGNREFHYLFALLRARAARMRHPLVCTNLLDTKGRALPFLPSLRFDVAGDDGRVRVHVLGLLIMQYPTEARGSASSAGAFSTRGTRSRPTRARFPTANCSSCSRTSGSRSTASSRARVPRIDLILGGHSHDTLERPEYVGDVPIVHAGPYGRFVSRSELEYDPRARRFALADFALLPLLGAAA